MESPCLYIGPVCRWPAAMALLVFPPLLASTFTLPLPVLLLYLVSHWLYDQKWAGPSLPYFRVVPYDLRQRPIALSVSLSVGGYLISVPLHATHILTRPLPPSCNS